MGLGSSARRGPWSIQDKGLRALLQGLIVATLCCYYLNSQTSNQLPRTSAIEARLPGGEDKRLLYMNWLPYIRTNCN